jgi:DNA-binding LacI/PurR family transcriptional regulator
MVTIKDVARAAHVSAQTVSNVFNKPEIVNETRKAAVLAAAKELGYRPNASARRLRTSRSETIGLSISPNTESLIYDRFLHALAGEADKCGFRITLYKADNYHDEISRFESLYARSDVDSFVLTGTDSNDPRPDWLLAHQQKFVLFGRPWGRPLDDPQLPWVDVDGMAGVRSMTQSLILRGCRRIGFIGWPNPSGTGEDRREGWKRAITEAKLLNDDDMPGEISSWQADSEEGIVFAQKAFDSLVAKQPRLDAIVCVSDAVATGVLLRAHMQSRNDIVVTGFDNTNNSQSLGFSSVKQPLDKLAAEAMRIILAQFHDDTHKDARNDKGDEGDSNETTPVDTMHVLLAPTVIER